MNCNNCLFYESSCIITNNNDVYGVEYCHFNKGKYDENNYKVVQSVLINDCEDYQKSIPLFLYDISEKYNITILFAVESGSRVWGFSNRESDFNVRFVFRYNDLEEYLKLNDFVDTLNISDGVGDFVGWDIGKALRLHCKSNLYLRECLLSDIVYVLDYEGVFDGLPSFDRIVLMEEYGGMACSVWSDLSVRGVDWLGGNDEFVLIKKYLYVLRCILIWHLLNINLLNPKINLFELLNQYQLAYNDNVLIDDIVSLIERYKGLRNDLDSSVVSRLYDYIVVNLKVISDENNNLGTPKKRDRDIYKTKYHKLINTKYK